MRANKLQGKRATDSRENRIWKLFNRIHIESFQRKLRETETKYWAKQFGINIGA